MNSIPGFRFNDKQLKTYTLDEDNYLKQILWTKKRADIDIQYILHKLFL